MLNEKCLLIRQSQKLAIRRILIPRNTVHYTCMAIIPHLSMSSMFPTHTANGRIFVLPLIEYIFSMACVSRAEAAKPYMVSVGTATTPPLSNNVTHSLTVSSPSLVLSIFRGACPPGVTTKLMIHIRVNKISQNQWWWPCQQCHHSKHVGKPRLPNCQRSTWRDFKYFCCNYTIKFKCSGQLYKC